MDSLRSGRFETSLKSLQTRTTLLKTSSVGTKLKTLTRRSGGSETISIGSSVLILFDGSWSKIRSIIRFPDVDDSDTSKIFFGSIRSWSNNDEAAAEQALSLSLEDPSRLSRSEAPAVDRDFLLETDFLTVLVSAMDES